MVCITGGLSCPGYNYLWALGGDVTGHCMISETEQGRKTGQYSITPKEGNHLQHFIQLSDVNDSNNQSGK